MHSINLLRAVPVQYVIPNLLRPAFSAVNNTNVSVAVKSICSTERAVTVNLCKRDQTRNGGVYSSKDAWWCPCEIPCVSIWHKCLV